MARLIIGNKNAQARDRQFDRAIVSFSQSETKELDARLRRLSALVALAADRVFGARFGVYFDHEGFEYQAERNEAIQGGPDFGVIYIPLLSNGFFRSRWNWELFEYFMDRPDHSQILPVLVEEIDVGLIDDERARNAYERISSWEVENWRELIWEDFDADLVRRKVDELASRIVEMSLATSKRIADEEALPAPPQAKGRRRAGEGARSPAVRPMMEIDRSYNPLASGAPPEWAVAWGEDAYGVFASFAVAGVEVEMRWVPPGRFSMGSPEDEPGRWEAEGPVHEARIGAGFWLMTTPVTQALYEAVTGENPSRFVSPDRPVERVSWEEATAFCGSIGLRLPSEAEWEWACRAGTETATYAGPIEILGERNAPILDAIAWYGGNSGVDFDLEDGHDSSGWLDKQFDHAKAGTRRVGLKAPNDFGLADMLGNVWEWCADHWRDNYDGAPTDGSAWTRPDAGRGALRVVRGGSWIDQARYVRSACRLRLEPSARSGALGFRCAGGHGVSIAKAD